MAARRFVVAGVYWPSKPFRETYDDEAGGTRGLQNPAEAMADAKAQLEDLKAGRVPGPAREAREGRRAAADARAATPRRRTNSSSSCSPLLDDSPLDETEGLPQIRKRPGSELLARLSAAPADGTRGIGDVVRQHRRRRRAVPESDEVVRHEGSVGHGRRHGRGHGRAGAARQMPGRQNPSRRPQPRRPVDGRLREGARRCAEAASRIR